MQEKHVLNVPLAPSLPRSSLFAFKLSLYFLLPLIAALALSHYHPFFTQAKTRTHGWTCLPLKAEQLRVLDLPVCAPCVCLICVCLCVGERERERERERESARERERESLFLSRVSLRPPLSFSLPFSLSRSHSLSSLSASTVEQIMACPYVRVRISACVHAPGSRR